MNQIELTPVQTLLRESITARINQTAEALCDADKAGNGEPMKQQPLELFTALAAQVASKDGSESEISHLVHTGALFLAKAMKADYIAQKLYKENEKLRAMVKPQVEVDAPIIDPDDFELVEPTEETESNSIED